MSPVRPGEPASGEVLPGVRDSTCAPVRKLQDESSRGSQVLFRVRDAGQRSLYPAARLPRGLHAEAPRRQDPFFEGRFGSDRIRTIRDLKGKTVAVPALDSSRHVFVSMMAAYVGLDVVRFYRSGATNSGWSRAIPKSSLHRALTGAS